MIDIFRVLFFLQPLLPFRAETEIKLGGPKCNIIMSRLQPWLSLHLSKNRKMVLQDKVPDAIKQQSTDNKAIMWTCNVSAPEMTLVLFNMSGSPIYHVSNMLFTVVTMYAFIAIM